MIVLTITGYFIWAIFELVPLYKQQLWRDLWANIALNIISLTIAILLCFNIKIPSPEQPIREFITSIFGK